MTDDTIDEAKLRDLMKDVEALPRSIEPPAEAWAKIRAEIDATGGTGRDEEVSGLESKRPARIAFWQRPMFLAAATLLLVAGSSAITAIALNRRGVPTAGPSAQTRIAAVTADSNGGPASLAQFTLVESDYLRAVNDLSAILESDQGSLSPETVAKLRESIKVIDAAILEARNALAADPANRTLIQMLANSYEQKVDLLKRTTEMARS
ncbi:MAG: hypothetical protein M3O61_01865 [Gemmatimonadota bacterium]|nr:hypothetical protein [Gemmatimonadota bacterium]